MLPNIIHILYSIHLNIKQISFLFMQNWKIPLEYIKKYVKKDSIINSTKLILTIEH